MLVLAIETSCDETSAAVVEDGRLVLSNIVSSQIAVHAEYGGVVPEIASRQHVKAIGHVVRLALDQGGRPRSAIDVIAATHGPGLAGSLLVGVTFARAYALGLGRPFVPVNHLEGHLHSIWLGRALPLPPAPSLPLLTLIVSGGHTELVLMREHGEYQVIGRTRDDAAGEAFDKVARLLGLPYPGGPSIQSAAVSATAPVRLPRAWLPGTDDFSFSGLKTAVLHMVFEMVEGRSAHQIRGTSLPEVDVAAGLSHADIANIAAGFQESVVDVLVTKTMAAARRLNVASIAVVGGVAANKVLRDRMQALADRPLFVAPPEFTTDNAAMIGSAAYFVSQSAEDVDVLPGLGLSDGRGLSNAR